ncbi:MAG: hypothetical protein WCK15_02905 [Pirellula sp.]
MMRQSLRSSGSQSRSLVWLFGSVRPAIFLTAIFVSLGAFSCAFAQQQAVPLPAQAIQIQQQRMLQNLQERVQPRVILDEDIDDEDAVIWGQGAFPQMDRQTMRESMFGALGGSEAAFQKLKRESIRRELDRINAICSLTNAQQEKLNEAIEIDIQHVHAKIETALSKFDSKMTVQQFQQIQQEIHTVTSIHNAISTQDGEVWRKVLRAQLTAEQSTRIEEDKQKVEANQSRTQQLKVLLRLQRKLGLTAKQRNALSEWIKEKKQTQFDFATIWKLLASVDDNQIPFTATQRKLLAQPLGPADLATMPMGELPQLNVVPMIQIRQR